MIRWAALLLLAATSCAHRTADAEERYRIVSQSGDQAEKCREARVVQGVYLEAQDDAKYREWKSTADIDCMIARYGAS